MGQFDWYKRYPEKALNGMLMLSLEERGAYNTLLDLIYLTDNRLHDDERFICGWLRCDLRVWKRIRARLIEAGKIQAVDGFLLNIRASSQIDAALATARLNASNARKSHITRKENKDLRERPLNGDISPHTENSELRMGVVANTAPDAPAPQPAKRAKGSRVPDDFEPSGESNEIGFTAGMTEKEISDELDKFMDYWRAKPGAQGVKLDWEATWRNWLRNEVKYRGKNQTSFGFNGHGGKRL